MKFFPVSAAFRANPGPGNAAINAIHANGTYQKIAGKYFDFDEYGK